MIQVKTDASGAVVQFREPGGHWIRLGSTPAELLLSSRKKRDLFVRKACQAAELPLLEVPAKSTYDTSSLSMDITALLSDPAKSQA